MCCYMLDLWSHSLLLATMKRKNLHQKQECRLNYGTMLSDLCRVLKEMLRKELFVCVRSCNRAILQLRLTNLLQLTHFFLTLFVLCNSVDNIKRE